MRAPGTAQPRRRRGAGPAPPLPPPPASGGGGPRGTGRSRHGALRRVGPGRGAPRGTGRERAAPAAAFPPAAGRSRPQPGPAPRRPQPERPHVPAWGERNGVGGKERGLLQNQGWKLRTTDIYFFFGRSPSSRFARRKFAVKLALASPPGQAVAFKLTSKSFTFCQSKSKLFLAGPVKDTLCFILFLDSHYSHIRDLEGFTAIHFCEAAAPTCLRNNF